MKARPVAAKSGANDQDESEDEAAIKPHPFDWRTRLVRTLKSDLPAACPGGPSHKAGAFVLPPTTANDSSGRNVDFPTPSAISLALSCAIKAAERARELQAQIEWSAIITPRGIGQDVTHESIPARYDYFEECMTVL